MTAIQPLIAGVDEAGRGPLAGPVVAAAVILDPGSAIAGLADSKKLSARRREALAITIRGQALHWSVGVATVAEIDEINILQAALLAMQRAVQTLAVLPTRLLIDGDKLPKSLPCPAESIIRGDQTVACISAASILAKTHRDALMATVDAHYPEYGFNQHKGYGTAQHLAALARLGVTPWHRRSFAPVRRVLQNAAGNLKKI